ncbi:ATP-dependent DNA ligase [Thalassotalea loyana]|uniref:ATP-dependent DNA ligase n=1 Tax=Thalassotalea loyana TaxID=280483 RepID=A0ABQ6HB50_9GAMM|nr:DNA ligase [Thalassotalea loyana]GLX83995.1 ATP-dependent DNA ligase [Thalassotalea loyana]
MIFTYGPSNLLAYLTLIVFISFTSSAKPLPLQHGKPAPKYIENIDAYLISEKLDGVRGYWDGRKLMTRNGHEIIAPTKFTAGWPEVSLDGELWWERGAFDKTSGCIRSKDIKPCWQHITFNIFDLPKHNGTFTERVDAMQTICQSYRKTSIRCIEQSKVNSIAALNDKLQKVIDQGGEGLMLHLATAMYEAKRVNHLFKLKPVYTDTAVVKGYTQGTGKYQHMVGALIVVNASGKTFKIGSGLSIQQRKFPPAIGQKIHYKYFGKTSQDMPRFASLIDSPNQQ